MRTRYFPVVVKNGIVRASSYMPEKPMKYVFDGGGWGLRLKKQEDTEIACFVNGNLKNIKEEFVLPQFGLQRKHAMRCECGTDGLAGTCFIRINNPHL